MVPQTPVERDPRARLRAMPGPKLPLGLLCGSLLIAGASPAPVARASGDALAPELPVPVSTGSAELPDVAAPQPVVLPLDLPATEQPPTQAPVGREFEAICLLPFDIRVPVASPPLLRAWMDQYLAHELGRSGYAVRSAQEVERVAHGVRAEERAFDPHTGLRDEPRRAEIERRVGQRLEAELGCSELLAPDAHVVRVPWQAGVARWDGSRRPMGGRSDAYGAVPGVSIEIEVRETGGRLVHRGFGGVQVAAVYPGGAPGGGARGVSVEDLLSRVRWNVEGVRTALGVYAGEPSDEAWECLRERYEERQNDRRGERGDYVFLEEARAWLTDVPFLGSEPDPVAARTLAECIAADFEFALPSELRASEEDPDPSASGPAPPAESPRPESDPDPTATPAPVGAPSEDATP